MSFSALHMPQISANLSSVIVICLLGPFRLLHGQVALTLSSHTKLEALLTCLALSHPRPVDRSMLQTMLWPDSQQDLAGQSLNSLLYSLRTMTLKQLNGRALVVSEGGSCTLNAAQGVTVDVACFDRHIAEYETCIACADSVRAMAHLQQAVELYQGDLCALNGDLSLIVERERLRARFLQALLCLADYTFETKEYVAAQKYAYLLLARDPCREDAHRFLMRLFTRLGQRSQALHQYQICRQILRQEYDIDPEPATIALYKQIQRDPGSV